MRIVSAILAGVLITSKCFGQFSFNIQTDEIYKISSSTIASYFNVAPTQAEQWINSKQLNITCIDKTVPYLSISNSLIFEAKRFENRYINKNVYWIQTGVGSNANLDLAPTGITNASLRVERNQTLLTDPAYYPYYPWVEKTLLSYATLSKSATTVFNTPSVVTGSYLTVNLFNTTTASITYDFNGRNLGTNVVTNIGPVSVVFNLTNQPIRSINTGKVTCVQGTIDYDDAIISYVKTNSPSVPTIISNLTPYYAFDFSPTNKADYVIITPTNYIGEANVLANYRRMHNLQSKVIPINAIYDRFNYGFSDPRAVRSCLLYIATQWQVGPQYVVFLGDGSIDYKNYLSNSQNMVPSFEVVDAEYNLRGTDAYSTDVDLDGAAEVALGRIPFSKTNEFWNWFAKLTNFEASISWKTNAIATADKIDGALNFTLDSESVIPNLTSTFNVVKNYLDYIGTVGIVQTNLVQALNSGIGLTTYFGHANQTTLGKGYNIFSTVEAQALTNREKPTVFLSMSCFANDFASVNAAQCLGETLVNSSGGAVAVWSSCGLVLAASSKYLAERYTHYMFQDSARIGSAIVKATHDTANYGDSIICASYNLLGDPATSFWNIDEYRGSPYYLEKPTQYSNWVSIITAPVLLDTGIVLDPSSDTDGDGMSNYEEFLAGSDIFNPSSTLRLTSIEKVDSGMAIKWNANNHVNYSIDVSTNLLGSFLSIGTVQSIYPTGSYTDSVINTIKFYRISVAP